MVRQSGSAQRREDYDEVAPRRNPYLVDYEKQRSRHLREAEGRGSRPLAYDRGTAGAGRSASNGNERVRIHRLDTDESRTAGGRRPIAYGSRMAGSRETYDGRAAADNGFAPDARGDYGRRFPEERMPGRDWDYASQKRNSLADAAEAPERGRRREVTTDMFDGYRNREPVRKGKIVQVAIPAGGNKRRQPQGGGAAGRQDAASARQRTGPNSHRERKQETWLWQTGHGAAGQRGEARRKAAVHQRGDIRQESMVRQRDRMRSPMTAPDSKGRMFRMRLLLGAWVLCILFFAVYFAVKNHQADTPKEDALPVSGGPMGNLGQPSGTMVQGIPADAFARHPEWTEDFLTPNEYSRPGEPLESVKNIFVHYTANPGTSAAQNRSYFEWQKDTHEASVSSHFIIGYEGEIIQCVPLDEIAYAVMTRNYDSVSIECCYLAEDGAFTQETYDSLISLLAWLTDIYGLDSEDILRHYDCGGKKCPLYYTEHEDAWEQLKKDVDKL